MRNKRVIEYPIIRKRVQTRGKIAKAENESDDQNKCAEWKWLSETERISRAHDETAK